MSKFIVQLELLILLDMYMETGNVSLENCIVICMDGASAMTGCQSGVVRRAKELNPMKLATHCILHRQALASKLLSHEPHSVLSTMVTVVIKSKITAVQFIRPALQGDGHRTGQSTVPLRGVLACLWNSATVGVRTNCPQSCANSTRMTSLPLQHSSKTPNGQHSSPVSQMCSTH